MANFVTVFGGLRAHHHWTECSFEQNQIGGEWAALPRWCGRGAMEQVGRNEIITKYDLRTLSTVTNGQFQLKMFVDGIANYIRHCETLQRIIIKTHIRQFEFVKLRLSVGRNKEAGSV